MLNELVSPFYTVMTMPLEKPHEGNISQSISSEFMCLKLQTWVLLITGKTFLGFLGRCFSLVRFYGRAAVVCVLAAGDWSWSRGGCVLLFQPLTSFQVMPCCVSPSEKLGDRCGGILTILLQIMQCLLILTWSNSPSTVMTFISIEKDALSFLL